jgi:hypothetical protein
VAVAGGLLSSGMDVWNVVTGSIKAAADYFISTGSKFKLTIDKPKLVTVNDGKDLLAFVIDWYNGNFQKLMKYNFEANSWTVVADIINSPTYDYYAFFVNEMTCP